MVQSIVEYYGWSRNSSCGYCKGKRPSGKMSIAQNQLEKSNSEEEEEGFDDETGHSVSLGVWAHVLSCKDYQEFLDRGWRRSGKYLYKPKMDETCCPQYTIRLDATKFYLSRSQKRVLRQMNEYLKDGKKPRCRVKEITDEPVVTPKTAEATEKNNLSHTNQNEPISFDSAKEKGDQPLAVASATTKATEKRKKDSDRPVKKKKEIRNERFEQKCKEKGLNLEEERQKRKEKEFSKRRTLDSFIVEGDTSWKYKLEVRLVSTTCPEFEERMDESFRLYEKYQTLIHEDVDKQIESYKRFLVESPLRADPAQERDGCAPIGAYHLWYLLGGKLIAVGVVDLLPKCLSAKYFFYDPEYKFLSMGTYSALREIHLTHEFSRKFPELKYYYMGYYITSCPKMRYKGTYRPSDLLCDKTWQWVPLSECEQLFPTSQCINGFTVFRPDLPIPEPPDYRDQTVYIKRVICRFWQCAGLVPNFTPPSANFITKLKELSAMMGEKLQDVAVFFRELNSY